MGLAVLGKEFHRVKQGIGLVISTLTLKIGP